MNDALHDSFSLSVPLVSRNRKEWGPGSPLRFRKIQEVFILHSPRIAKIEVIRKGKVRQAKLYYLRGVSGKKAKVKEKIGSKKKKMVIEDEAYAAPLQEENPAEVKEAAPKAEKKKAAKPKKEEKSASEETPPEESKE